MADLTLRSIPEDVMARLRTLAATERRSLNGEILVLVEAGLERCDRLITGNNAHFNRFPRLVIEDWLR